MGCGLTGRRTASGTYGGMAPHGGGAISGKDPARIERCGAYAARHIACNIVAAGLADRCEVQIVYAAGIADPIALDVNTDGSGRIPDADIADVIAQVFDDLRPDMIIRDLDLMRPIYQAATADGLFGRQNLDLPWERRDRVDVVREAALERDPGIAFRKDRFTLDGRRVPASGWGGFSNDDFFRILESEAYRYYCYGKYPILKDNGGLEFYNPDNLRHQIKLKKEALLKAWHPKHQWHFRNGIAVTESWLQQVNWIIDRLRQGK